MCMFESLVLVHKTVCKQSSLNHDTIYSKQDTLFAEISFIFGPVRSCRILHNLKLVGITVRLSRKDVCDFWNSVLLIFQTINYYFNKSAYFFCNESGYYGMVSDHSLCSNMFKSNSRVSQMQTLSQNFLVTNGAMWFCRFTCATNFRSLGSVPLFLFSAQIRKVESWLFSVHGCSREEHKWVAVEWNQMFNLFSISPNTRNCTTVCLW